MDNHRAALWCWQQQIDLYSQDHCLLHIDRHTDCLGANLDLHLNAMPNLQGLPIDDYLNASVNLPTGPAPLFRWDNYLSIHIAAFGNNLRKLISADHDDGDRPDHRDVWRPLPHELPENILYWMQSSSSPWIVNVDLDYFFCAGENGQQRDEGEWLPLFSEHYINSVFSNVQKGIDAGLVKAVTVCLTPSDFTPGWQQCSDLSQAIFKILGAKHPKI
jgi:hypothetical protein